MTAGASPLLLGMEWYLDNPGGLHRYLADLVRALAAAGTPAQAVLLGPATDAPVGVVAAGRAGQGLPRRLWCYARAAHRARRGADVVDAHFALFAFLPVVLGRLRTLPLVVHFQGPWAEESISDRHQPAPATWARRAVELSVYRRAREVIVLSTAFQRTIVESYGVAPWRVNVIPPGVDLNRFRPGDKADARARLNLPSDGPVAVAVRRLVPRTGVDVLIEAWRRLQLDRAGGVLLLVGDGPERVALETQARDLGVDRSVSFLGLVDEPTLVACYQAADVAVVPSVALEGFGLIVLEALACGTPVVATDAGGLREALTPLDPTLVVPAGDAGSMADRLRPALMGDGAMPDPERCRGYAETFSWESVAERHQAVYERAVRPMSGKLRVVYVDHCARLAGGEVALLRLLPALLEVDAHVILAEDGPLVARMAEAGISVEVLPMAEAARGLSRHRVDPARLPIASALGSGAYVVRLARRLRRLRPDLVHTNSLKAAVYGGMAGRIAGVPVVWHVRDRIADGYLPAPARLMVWAMARRIPAAVIANSKATLETMAVGSTPAHVIHSPVVLDPPLPSGRGIGGRERLRVGMVGRLAPWKGQTVFLDAFARAFPDGDVGAAVVGAPMFGEETYRAELVRHAEGLGIGHRVDFRGFCSDVAGELMALDVLVHASTIPEPFGLVVVEGMAAGLPVVAADAGGPAEVITDGVDGLLYPMGDVEALAAVLRHLDDDPELRRRLGAAGRHRAADFTPEVIAAQVMVVYRSALSQRRPIGAEA